MTSSPFMSMSLERFLPFFPTTSQCSKLSFVEPQSYVYPTHISHMRYFHTFVIPALSV